MKNLLHNISILEVFALMMVGIQSCSDDWQEVGDVRVSFTATLPTDTRTRSFGKAEQVNTLVVGIFKKGVADVDANSGGSWSYHEIDRKSFPIYGTSADVQLTLAQEQTYSFIFWAYDSNQNIYNIDDLTAIKMNTLPNPITFTQAKLLMPSSLQWKILPLQGIVVIPLNLSARWLKSIIGTTGKTMQATFTANDAPNTFHPFTSSVSGASEYTWNFSETTTEIFSADGAEYNYLAMDYVFAPTTPMQIESKLTLADKTFNFTQLEIEANQRSNIAGNFTPTE